jgi:uncharacterized protein (TIGR03067 family)
LEFIMRLLLFAFALAGTVWVHPVARSDDSPEVKKELEKFQGRWRVDSIDMGDPNNTPAADVVKTMRIEIKGDNLAFYHGDDKAGDATLKINPKEKHVDLKSNQERGTLLGIYAFDGEKLKMCLVGPPDGKERERPKKFEARKLEDGEHALLVLEREKKQPSPP